ncbi:hypothetical protein TKK_0008662 [Trichogramma kaykai]|uniref:Phospholipid/glycerol acyltransferase domain-containing protein n=1 Tax=Trichogramma kaykai TaxID=54128 RepID=A0ABD2X5A8_9HYME
MKEENEKFTDVLIERRKTYDFLWASRSLQLQPAYKRSGGWIYSRKEIIDHVLENQNVELALNVMARQKNVPLTVVQNEARLIIEEIAGKMHMPTVRWLALILSKILKRILVSIRLNDDMLINVKNEMRKNVSQFVFVPTHRSYMDFILLSYLFFTYDMTIPNIASGMDFYHMKYVGEMLRKLGAFYMRRTFSNDPFYKHIFKAYISTLVAHSDRAIEFFIEGTRSRSQKTLTPKYGLLSMILESLYLSQVPEITFIPVSISYDKPLEERLFAYELLGVPKPPETTSGLFRSLSILKEPLAYGNVFFKFGIPIRAGDYVTHQVRFENVCRPEKKLPHEITTKLAYDIIECHKQNTILLPFNLVALLFNNRVYTNPKDFYSVDNLILDYKWLKQILIEKFQINFNPTAVNAPTPESMKEDIDKYEVLNSLQTHKDLLGIDSDQNIKIKDRHIGGIQSKSIKGYSLKETTLKLAIPVINVMIYVNPVFAYLSRPAMAAFCILTSQKDLVLKNYIMLRSLLSGEFALPTHLNESDIQKEGEMMTEFLSQDIYIQPFDENAIDNKNRLNLILSILILPFVGCLQNICKVLIEWCNVHNLLQKTIVIECQKLMEESLYHATELSRHPYTLALDVYPAILSSLVKCGHVTLDENQFYKPNKENLVSIVVELDNMLGQCSNGSYLNAFPSLIPEEILNLQAKL